MARITRRRLLQFSGAGMSRRGPAASRHPRRPDAHPPTRKGPRSIGCAGPISSRRPTVLRQDQIAPECEKALGDQAQARDDQRQRHAGARHLGDPIRQRPRHHHACSTTGRSSTPRASPMSATWPRRSARRKAAFTRSRKLVANDGKKWIARAVDYRRRADRLSQIVVRGGRLHRRQIPGNLGANTARPARNSRPRADRSAKPSATLSATRPPSGIRICGRGAARRSRRTARPWCSNSKETVEVGQIHGWLLERRLRRGRPRLGRFQQQPRASCPARARHQQRRLDLYRSEEEARSLPDREGHAAVEGHLSMRRCPRDPAASSASTCHSPTW